MSRNILLVDNLDSFSFNLVEAFERLGCKVQVLRNSCSADAAYKQATKDKALIILSPGPGRPEEAGSCMNLITLAKGKLPLLGVCLGHQAIIAEGSGTVSAAPAIVHGRASRLEHDGEGLFKDLASPIRVGRYHSLCTLEPPTRFHVHARLEGMVMAVSDNQAKQFGLQFHPESILTPVGDKILSNLLESVG
ncbi:MAG TPA: aminodeoxychorismate/anthranilate synthase component II [Sphingomicrobium sp.]|nr:aminodeoxychorismate/anthranilate synthase component II [Sphingomicrobium sp.]